MRWHLKIDRSIACALLFIVFPLISSGGRQDAAAQDIEEQPKAAALPVVQFPFENVGTKLFVAVQLNDSEPLSFILDTGCPPAFVVDFDRAQTLGLELHNEQLVHTGAGEGKLIKSARAPGVTLGVHGAIMPNHDASVLQLDHVSEFIGRRVDGLLGNGFIKHFVMEIDYQANTISLFKRETFEYTGNGRRIPIEYHDRFVRTRSQVLIPGRDEPIDGRFVIDTGAGGAIHFTRPFVEREGLLDAGMKTISAAFAGAGGDVRASICRISGIRWGPFHINEPVATLSHDRAGFFASESLDGILGAEILQRCRVIFDYTGGTMILEPFANVPEPYEADMSGAFVTAKAPTYQQFFVKSVQTDTPASDAGLQSGDEIISINGRPASDFSLVDLARMFRKADTTVHLIVRRGEDEIVIDIALRRLVMLRTKPVTQVVC